MTNDEGKLSHLKPYKGSDAIYVGNGDRLPISHIGNACVIVNEGPLKLKDVLVVPDLQKNLMSIGKLTSNNLCTFEFTASDFVVKDCNQRIIVRGHKNGQLCVLGETSQEALSARRKGDSSKTIWHQRLGQPNSKILSLLKEKKTVDIIHWMNQPTICISCQRGKSCKLPFHHLNKISKYPLEKIHYDL